MTRDEARLLARKIGSYAGYPAFYLFCVLFFTGLCFPFETLKERIVLTFNAQQRAAGAPQELQIDDLSSSWLTGVKATGVRLVRPSSDPKTPPVTLAIDQARAHLSLFALLIGHKNVSFSLKAFGGDVDGEYDEQGKDRHVEVDLDGIDIGQIEPLTQMIGMPLEGKFSGSVVIDMPDGKATKGTGTVALEGTDIAVGDGKAKLKGALALPRLSIGALSIAADAKDGVLKITKFSAGGKDMDLSGEGKLLMRDIATDSICDVILKFKINDGYRGKTDVTKNLFGAPGSTKGGDVELFVPQMKAAKRSDGYYSFHVRGLLGKPDFEPAPNAVGPGGVGGGLGERPAPSARP